MERETREKKYAKLRDEIENIDTTILENMERNRNEKKSSILKESMQHLANAKKVGTTSNDLSIEEILKAHTEYVSVNKQDNHKQNFKEKRLKNILCVVICIILVIVITIVIISIFRR